MRNINNPQLNPSITRALKHNVSFSQEPESTWGANKRVEEILDAKYDEADLLAIVKDNCRDLTTSERESLLALLFKFEQLFDGTWGEWNTCLHRT